MSTTLKETGFIPVNEEKKLFVDEIRSPSTSSSSVISDTSSLNSSQITVLSPSIYSDSEHEMQGINPFSKEAFTNEVMLAFDSAEESDLLDQVYFGRIHRVAIQAKNLENRRGIRAAKKYRDLRIELYKYQTKVNDSSYQLYLNAFNSKLPFIVIGGKELRTDGPEIVNFGISSGSKPNVPVSLRKNKNLDTKTGSILSDSLWSVLKNDIFMLGAIQGKKTFYLFIDRDTGSLNKTLWDRRANRPRMTGREISMLYAAGYRQVATKELSSKYGFTFVSTNPEKSENITLQELIDFANGVTNRKDLYSFLDFTPKKNS